LIEKEDQDGVIAMKKTVEETEKVEVQENHHGTIAVAAEALIAAIAQVYHGMFLKETDAENARCRIIIDLTAITPIFRVKVREVEVIRYKAKMQMRI
jgi:hypothetical protein